MRRTLVLALVAGTAILAGCASTARTTDLSAGAAITPSTATASTTTTTAQQSGPSSTTDTTDTTATTSPTTSTTAATDPITAASAAITQALTADGHSQAYATCVIHTATTQFTGNEARFIAGALALGHPTDSRPVDALQQIPLTDQEKADIPGHLQAVYDLCASTDN